ncbi:MAG: TAXI family TRAP transporter solute-binding subunit [Hyphomicrobiales bacterium]|nr:TAXI family TRAP transporter solute-binding subunit [Hyphomicrobiales bacterium]
MKQRILILFAALFAIAIAGADTASAQSQLSPYEKQKYERNRSAVSIIGGGINGTYIRYATDLANVLDDLKGNEMRVLPLIGRGGGQNVLDILFLRGIDMGLTQQDHLAFFKALDPKLYGDIDKRVRYITKLYNSEYHLIARTDVKKFEDLRGKTVNFWRPWSATDIGSQTIFRLLGIDVKPIYIDTATALEKIKSGEIAATVLLAGAPVPGYAKLKQEDGLHIVPLGPDTLTKQQYDKLLEVYLPTKLSHKQYPEIIPEGQEVPSVASGVVLAVYNWTEDTERYQKVARFVDKFFSSFDKLLKPPRHPKWKTVNLAAELPGWTRFKAAEEWLAQARANPSNETQQAFNAFLQRSSAAGGNITGKQKEKLFQEFVEWWRTRPQ